ncbi:hypothetical protein V6N12_017918 [Hibiscus sabdariffa]|uniref:Uncharacterized protein n=1 Tax=Hibiscus sabdariffa TaxID=183260 RepID=A0ABR2BM37_9ROSI
MVIVVEMDNLMLGWIKNNSGRSGIAARHERNLWKIRARCFMMVHRWVKQRKTKIKTYHQTCKSAATTIIDLKINFDDGANLISNSLKEDTFVERK